MSKLRLNLDDLIANCPFVPSIIEIDIEEKLAEQKAITVVWHTEDVQFIRPDLTEEQSWEVLKLVRYKHNADLGINWEELNFFADRLFPKTPPTQKGNKQ